MASVEFALPIPVSAAVKQAPAIRVLDALRSAGAARCQCTRRHDVRGSRCGPRGAVTGRTITR
jgi:hypothetical protein